jgi:chemotaxis protein methyltransferase CheR
VRFLQGNLLDSPVLEHEAFDVVFCRNVLMYFTPEQAAVVVRRLWTTLKPGGYLFLGHAENLRGLSDDFELRHTHGAFYYERKPTRDAARADSALRREIVPPERAGRPGLEATATDWLGVVDGSTQRIVALSHRALVPSPAQSPAASSTTEVRARVLDLVEKELFHQALQAIDELEESEIDGDLLLVRAAIMTHSGQVILAERACQALLATGRRSAAAHYLLGLLDERRGHDIRSLEHVQAASDLDSSFAMPLLHLGLRAVRSGDGTSARALLGRARDMLEREAPLHLLLFGGGFQRAGLVQMCQAELSRLGGSP